MADDRFAADWLGLREPVDHASRDDALLEPLVERWGGGTGVRIVDLGSGTGSNVRYLAPRLPCPQHWTLVDHDRALLLRVGDVDPAPRSLELVAGDLDREGLEALTGADLVTASALLDLVSVAWLDRLVAACARSGSAALFALTWNGDVAWTGSSDPEDASVLDAVRIHQRREKGLGAALGPAAGGAARARFEAVGYRTRISRSPWRLDSAHVGLLTPLVHGWAEAASEIRPDRSDAFGRWADRRIAAVASGAVALRVGHTDLLAVPESWP